VGLIAGARRLVIDGWSWLNYKPVFSDPARGMPNRRVFPEAQAMWVPAHDERRLAAYKLLTAYDNNQAAELAAVIDGDAARDRREFGDPAMFVETLLAHVLGREQHIAVAGAEQSDTGTDPAGQAAEHVQDLLREWADTELLAMRMQQTERKAVALGDGVYRLAWNPRKQRVALRSVDPGFYFPVIGEDDDGGEYPERVHFAWELPEDPKRGLKGRLRRITYELAPIGPATSTGVDGQGRAVRAPLTAESPDGEIVPAVGPGDSVHPDTGLVTRQYAWNDEPSTVTCYLTDATWELGDLRGQVDVDSLPMDTAQFATRSDGEVLDRLDLLIDFIPVIHIPNTVPPAEEHWGQSSLAKVLQVFDELQGADTDSARASATTGLPMIGISGVTDPRAQMNVAPGAVFKLPGPARAPRATARPVRTGREQHAPARRVPGHHRPVPSPVRVRHAAVPGPVGLPDRRDAAGPRPQVQAAAEVRAAPPPRRTAPRLARRHTTARRAGVRPVHADRQGVCPRAGHHRRRWGRPVPGDRGQNADGGRVPHRGRRPGDRPYPVPPVRRRPQPRRRPRQP
jgi:hypothetical protein